MAILLIIVAFALVGYFIYQGLPTTQFEKANQFFEQAKYVEAIAIYQKIFDKLPYAPSKLAECKLIQGEKGSSEPSNSLSLFYEILEIKKKLNTNANREAYEKIEAKAAFAISKINFGKALECGRIDAKSAIDALRANINHVNGFCKTGLEPEFKSLVEKHNDELASCYYTVGTIEEKKGNLNEAIFNYDNCNQLSKADDLLSANCITRAEICDFKKGDLIRMAKVVTNPYLFEKADNSSLEIKNDFYFRQAINLLKNSNFLEAEGIITTKLSKSSTEVEKLKAFIKNYKIKDALKKIDELNEKLDELYNSSFPIDKTKQFYDSLDETYNAVRFILPNISSKILEAKPSIFNRILSTYLDTKQFGNAITLILKYPKFWESPELLKNVAICCYHFTQKGQLNEKNYKIIISSWVTAVFSDKVMLNSLETTTWDDEYTFTLADAVGSNYRNHSNLPENINFDEVTEANISIGATQKQLLQIFESILNNAIDNEDLLKLVQDFFSQEKEALENIVTFVSSEIFLAAPFFAKHCNIHEDIIIFLDSYYEKNNVEEALEAGVPYLKGKPIHRVGEYYLTKSAISEMVSAIKRSNLQDFTSNATASKKNLFEKFKSLANKLEEEIFNVFTKKIEENSNNEKLIPILEQSIKFCLGTERMRYQYSNFVSALCVNKVNQEKMTYFRALDLMRKSYLFTPDNYRVCSNLITVIRFNLMEILNDKSKNSSPVYTILEEILPKRSKTFIQQAKELSEARKELLAELVKVGVDISVFNQEEDISLSSWGKPLRTQLTPEGERMKKVLSYFKKLSASNNPLGHLKTFNPITPLGQRSGLFKDFDL